MEKTDSTRILKEWEEHYNKNLQILIDFDKSFDSGSSIKYRYDKRGKLIEEIYTMNEKKRTQIDSTKYFYNSEGKLTNSVLKGIPYRWARDTFIYSKGMLVKKIHVIPVDSTPSITVEEAFETLYYYEENVLKRRFITYHNGENFTIDSLFYDQGTLIKQVSTDCQNPRVCVRSMEYSFDKNGNLTGMIQYTYPNLKLVELIKAYNSKGLQINSVFIDYSNKRKSIRKFVYQ